MIAAMTPCFFSCGVTCGAGGDKMKTENRLKNKSGRGRKQTAILAAGLFLYMAAAVMTAGRPAQASTVHWQDAFIMQAQSALQNAPDSSFYLIDLDGDDVLEMIINYGSVAGSEEIFSWYGDHLTSWMYEYYAFGYIPGTSQVHIGGGRQGGYYDEIYRYQDGSFILLASGTYTMNGTDIARDADGKFIMNDQFDYTWAGQAVSAQQYLLSLNAVYDTASEVSPYDTRYDLNGLIQALNDHAAGPQVIAGQTGGQMNMEFVSSDVSEYPNVRLYFDCSDSYGQPLTLTSLSGTIRETIAGGAEIERTIRSIEKLVGNQGLSIDIVADKSGSMEDDLWTMQSIMSDFVRSLDYSTGDEVEILSFDSYVMYMCTYTQDISLLLNGISNMTAYGNTALYDALYTGVMNAGSRAGARCVIGFTDGEDNESMFSAQDVINLAQQREVPVYLIGTSWADADTLSYICTQTGGYYWSIDNISGIGQILQTIYANQKEMYCVEYESDPGADPYAARTVSCLLSDGVYQGGISGLSFQATPVISQVQHTSRYELIKGDVSWTQANNACIARGGHLATITSQEEMNELVRMCEAYGVKYCWIGGYTSVRNNTAFGHWITGEPFNFTAWYPGEPSRNDHDGTPEFYLMLWNVEGAWSWNDQRDDLIATGLSYFAGNIGYICEYES